MHLFLRLGLLTVILLTVACRGSKDIPKAKKHDLTDLIDSLSVHQRDFTWFSAKAKVKFEGQEMRVGGRANIRMIKDSLIWMNFKKLSIEGSRALITQDSFWIVYRLDKMYESGTFQELMDAYDLSFSFGQLQDYIVGNYPVPQAEDVKSYSVKKMYDLTFYQDDGRYNYAIDGAYQLRQFDLLDLFGRRVSGTYSDFDQKGFAYTKTFEVDIDPQNKASISINLLDVEFDVPKTISFDVPSHYYKLP